MFRDYCNFSNKYLVFDQEYIWFDLKTHITLQEQILIDLDLIG